MTILGLSETATFSAGFRKKGILLHKVINQMPVCDQCFTQLHAKFRGHSHAVIRCWIRAKNHLKLVIAEPLSSHNNLGFESVSWPCDGHEVHAAYDHSHPKTLKIRRFDFTLD